MAITKVANIVTITDFVGEYKLDALIPQTNRLAIFNDFITDKQYYLLVDMLGVELYNDFATNPTATKWLNFIEGEQGYDDCCGCVRNWLGLVDLMLPFIHSLWIEFNEFKQNIEGTVNQDGDVVNTASGGSMRVYRKASEYELKTIAYKRWNEFIHRYNEAYIYLYSKDTDFENISDYFIKKEYKSLINKDTIR